MSQTLDQKARDAAHVEFREAQNRRWNSHLPLETLPEPLDAAIDAFLAALPPPEGDVRKVPLTSAWLGYWPGAGSIDSVTRVTRSEHTAEQWRADGGEVTELIERLSRQLPAPTGEVVALVERWQKARRAMLDTAVKDDNRAVLIELSNAEDALFRAAAAPQSPMGEGTVGVKPLEWFKSAPRSSGGSAETIVGRYHVWTHHEAMGQWFWRLTPYGLIDPASGVVANDTEGYAAAQADYETRILSALSTSRQGTGK